MPKRRPTRAVAASSTADIATTEPEQAIEAPPPPKPAPLPAKSTTVAPVAREAKEKDVKQAKEVKAIAPVAPVATAPAAPMWKTWITYENAFYVAIFALALFTRFYDIGNRALHHDESLHSVYSGNLYTGVGYQHDPMMHGPEQFNLIAFMYWLFGRGDDTVRFASALCGIFVVMSPFFLRKQMGR